MIRAEIHSDDMRATAKFDATPFFEEAGDEQILGLAQCEWGGDYEADDVARDVRERPGYASVDAVFEHVRRNPGNGFECHVHPTDAYAWVEENRPGLLDDLRRQMFIEGEAPYVGPEKPHWDADASWDGDYAVSTASSPAP